jgi:pimeloyl-ACP methyl ester carboxylesterase
VDCYRERGSQGGLNWYRTRAVCYEDEKHLPRTVPHPALMVTVGRDPALPASMAARMERNVPRLTRAHIEEAGHWVLVERHAEVTDLLCTWLQTLPGSAWAGARAVL